MKITFLGTGTSQGVPFIGCTCPICTSSDPRDNRLRSAVHIQIGGESWVIDTGPDFRYQMLRAGINRLNGILFTHSHKDHIAGMDDIRAFNYWQQEAIDVYSSAETLKSLQREFYYIFSDHNYPGIPQIETHVFDNKPFLIRGIAVIPIRALHLEMEVYGFRIGDFTYLTDANFIAPEELDKIRGSKVFVLNALRRAPHISHFHLDQAIEIAREVNAGTTYLTHISHQLGLHEVLDQELPPDIRLAHDGLSLEIPDQN